MKKISIPVFFYAISLLAVPPQDEDIASGRMGGGRSGGGGSHIPHGGGVRGSIPAHSSSGGYLQQPPYPNESEEPEEEPSEDSTEVHDLPSFTLHNNTATLNLGETIQIKISEVTGEPPITVWWHFGNDPWIPGGEEFTHPADKSGVIEISVVIQDNNGLFSQPQTTQVTVLPANETPIRRYEENMPPNQNEAPENKPSPEESDTNLPPFLNLDSGASPQDPTRLRAKLSEDAAALKQMEKVLQDELDRRNRLASRLGAILTNQQPPKYYQEDKVITNEIEFENYFIDATQAQIDSLVKDITKLNNLLK